MKLYSEKKTKMNTFLVLCVCFLALIGTAVTQRSAGLSRRWPPGGCGPVCLIYCEHGNVLDHRGCPTCRCRPGPGPSPGGRCPIYRSRGYSRRRFCFGRRRQRPCWSDRQCRWNQKCCNGPCGRVCTYVRFDRY